MYPQSPPNVFVTPTYTVDGFVVRWDNPFFVPANTSQPIIGCNVYRSLGSPDFGFEKLTEEPVQGLSFSDLPAVRTVTETPISLEIPESTCEMPMLKVAHIPIVGSQGSATSDKAAVQVLVNGQPIRVLEVHGDVGTIVLDTRKIWDPATRQLQPNPEVTHISDVRVTYTYEIGRAHV